MLTAICEDDKAFAALLNDNLRRFFADKDASLETVFFESGDAVLEAAEKGAAFDFILMDINLGGGSDGIATVGALREAGARCPVIFVTSYENRALDGYDVEAFGFVIKRELEAKLPRVLLRLWNEYYCRRTIVANSRDSSPVLELSGIICAESDKRQTIIHTDGGDLADLRSIQRFSELLPRDDFIECYKSVFVNISRIKCINADTVVMDNELSLPLSRRSRKTVMAAVMRKVAGK